MGAITNEADAIFAIVEEEPPNVNANHTGRNTLAHAQKLRDLLSRGQFGGLYERWRDHTFARKGWGAWVYGDGDEEKNIPKLEPINWGHLYDMYGRLAKMSEVGGGLTAAMTAAHSGIGTVWRGDAATAALAKFDDVVAGATLYQDSNTKLSGAVLGLWRNTSEAVDELVKFADPDQRGGQFVGIYGNTDAGFLSNISYKIDGLNTIASQGFPNLRSIVDRAREDYEFCIDIAYDHYGPFPEGLRLYEEITRAVFWLDDLASQYNEVVTEWRARIKTCCDAVKADFELFGDVTGPLTIAGKTGEPSAADPFAKIAPPAPQTPPEQPREPVDQPRDPGESTRNPGGGGGGGGPTPPAVPAMPAMPAMSAAPEMPQATDPAGTDPTSASPGLGGTPAAGPPETVTIKDGDRTISVDSPDGQGRVKVTVDDGSGTPKTYELDFAAAAEPGADQPVRTLPYPADGAVSAGVEQVQAGPDGKVVVEDGGLTITAERPDGSPDTVRITLDDGSGDPTTYTLDYQDPAHPKIEPATAAPDAAGGQADRASVASGPGAPESVASGQPAAESVAGGSGAGAGGSESGQTVGDSPQSTFAASDSGAGLWGAAGSVFGDEAAGPSGDSQTAGAGEAGLSSAQAESGSGHAQPGGQSGSGLGGGMPMMGGMGGGAGGSGDQDRGGSQWRTQGELFDDDYEDAEVRVSGALGDSNR
ncbi:hypothetical protein [Actinokineospora sp.]|uniref:hypothetical protein n=1 Tax=Actinokineospora sp. TaxID=1872133 RepID=UPI00403780CF